MRNKILLIVLTPALALSSCQSNATNQTTRPASTISAATPNAPGGSGAPSTEVKNYNGTGTVTKINLEIGSVELDHEEIKNFMPKMIMEFYVSDKAQLKDLKVGDRVDFVLEDKGGAERIVNIKKRPKL